MKAKKLLIVTGNCLLIATLVFLTFCKKDKKTETPSSPSEPAPATTEMASGFPMSKTSVNGYFYACYEATYTSNFLLGANITAFAVFGNPSRNLMANFNHQTDVVIPNTESGNFGNVAMGQVTFSGYQLNEIASSTSTDFIKTTSAGNFNFGTNWNIGGASGFSPFALTVPRGFPVIEDRLGKDTLSLNKDFTIEFNGFISNFDSVTVRISNTSNKFTNIAVQKTVGKVDRVTFKAAEFSNLVTSSNATIYFRAFNYSNKKQDSKTYIFELSNKHRRDLMIKY